MFFTLSLNLALFRLIVAINKRAVNVFLHRNDRELHYLCIWNVITLVWCTGDFEKQVLLQYRGEFWFLLVLLTSCNVLFTTSLRDHSGGIYLCMNVSGGVCRSCVSQFDIQACCISCRAHECSTHLRGVNTLVLFLTCSQKANPCCVPLGEMLDSDDLDPARLRQRKSKIDYVDLVSRSHEADGVWG